MVHEKNHWTLKKRVEKGNERKEPYVLTSANLGATLKSHFFFRLFIFMVSYSYSQSYFFLDFKNEYGVLKMNVVKNIMSLSCVDNDDEL